MDTNIQATAKIYQFPVGGRRSVETKRNGNLKAVTEMNAQRVFDSVVGGSWYHEEAIKDSEPKRQP